MFLYSGSCLGGVPIPTGVIGVCAYVLFMAILFTQFCGVFM